LSTFLNVISFSYGKPREIGYKSSVPTFRRSYLPPPLTSLYSRIIGFFPLSEFLSWARLHPPLWPLTRFRTPTPISFNIITLFKLQTSLLPVDGLAPRAYPLETATKVSQTCCPSRPLFSFYPFRSPLHIQQTHGLGAAFPWGIVLQTNLRPTRLCGG